jgi:hypothetical protein
MLQAFTSNMSMRLLPLNPIPFETEALSFFISTALARAIQRLKRNDSKRKEQLIEVKIYRASSLSRRTCTIDEV